MGEGPANVLRFWFSDRVRALWFHGNVAFDTEIRDRFGDTVEQAIAGALGEWEADGEGTLALVIVLDQLTRNIFRGTPRAFAGDARAIEVARRAVDRHVDRSLSFEQCMFLYMPFQHSEQLADQKRSLELFSRRVAETAASEHASASEDLEYAQRHHDIIERFGRFPHRNVILGRQSTSEEIAFLATPGSSF